MTPKLLKELKGVNFSCTSPSSSSINTTTINQHSILMTAGIGGRAIDRCSPHLRDPLRAKSLNPVLLSQPTKTPKNFNSKGKNKTTELPTSPASSQRYLLSTDSNSEDFSEPEVPVRSVTVNEASKFQYSSKVEEATVVISPYDQPTSMSQTVRVEESSNALRPSSSATAKPQEQQVVVLRVSLHCKGCEGKVRKHISKMEGVTSFTTDLINKKVTVIGDVTPLGVLNSISKVKNAQLWPSQIRASS